MKYGYARVSTDDQSHALQLAALKRAGCKIIFKDEGLSGATVKRVWLLMAAGLPLLVCFGLSQGSISFPRLPRRSSSSMKRAR